MKGGFADGAKLIEVSDSLSGFGLIVVGGCGPMCGIRADVVVRVLVFLRPREATSQAFVAD